MKESITARYDPRTDKIEGCRYGTKAWHHEDRHRQQFNNKKLQFFIHLLTLLTIFGKGLVVLSLVVYLFTQELGAFIMVFGACFLVPDFLLDLWLEYDAIKYAKDKKCLN